MKRYWKRLLILTCAPVLVWMAVHAQSSPGAAPFAVTQFIRSVDFLNVTPNIVLLARKSDSSYVQVGYRSDSPFSLFSSLDSLVDLLSGGYDAFINGPAGPLNVGRASQPVVGGKLLASGTPGVALVGPGGLTVYLGSSSLLFTGSTFYPMGDRTFQVVSADFNGDSAQDLAAIYGQGDSRRVAVMLNQGGGFFSTPISYVVGNLPAGLATLDVNRDGRNDLVVVGDSSIYVMFGNANGTFQSAIAYPAGPGGISATIADVNGDGFPDISSTASDNSVTVLLNNGNGTFRAGSTFQTGVAPVYIAAGDFNSDGRMDLATANQGDNTVSVFLGLGNGSFQLSANYYATVKAASLVITDYNRDGNLDILNGYGDARMIGAGDDTVNIDIMLGNGDGSFRALSGTPAVTAGAQSFVTVADFNGDGIPDSVIGDFFGTNGRNLYLFAGRANGLFQTPTPITTGSGQVQVRGGTSGDFDGDGRPDLVVTQGAIAVLLNNGVGFGPASTFSSGGSGADGVVTADFNGDGKLDLAVANSGSGNTAVFFGGGNGTFQLQQTYSTGTNPSKIIAADLNGDQKLDLVVTVPGVTLTSTAGHVFVLMNNGNGTFQAATPFNAGTYPAQTAVGDLNGDGKADMIVATMDASFNGELAVFRGLGNGNFAAPTILATPSNPVSVGVSDFNADGKLDVIVAQCCNTANMLFLPGNGDGTFATGVPVNGGLSQVLLQVADLNRDGRQDLLIAANPAVLRTLLNTTPPAVAACGYVLTPPVGTASALGDTLQTSILTADGCPWSVSGLPSWVTISGTPRSGSGSVTVNVASNSGVARTATMLIAGISYTVVQPGASDCVYTLGPGGQAFPAAGGTQVLTINTLPNCSWSVIGQPSWITFIDPPSGTGSGTLTYKAAVNAGAARSAGMLLGGSVFILEQAAATTAGLSNQGSLTHIASAGTWKMTMNYINTNLTPSKSRVSFFDDNGDPLPLPISFPQSASTAPAINGFILDRTIEPGAQLILESTGPDSQATAIGSGQLLAVPGILGFGIFSNPSRKWEALVPLETRSTNSYLLAFDNAAPIATGVALANQTTATVSITVVIRDDSGNQTESQVITLPGRGHSSFMLSDRFQSAAGRRGTAEFSTPSAGQISVVGLRANGSALTTLPLLANVGTGGGTITHMSFNGGFGTSFTLVNTSNSPAPARLNFFDDRGNPLSVPVFFPQTGTNSTASAIDRTLLPRATLVVETNGSDTLPEVTGAATVTTNATVGGFAIFRLIQAGQEASVPMETRNAGSYLLPFDNTTGLVTGVAVANGGGAAATVAVTIRSETGALLQTSTIDVPTQGHRSFLLADVFQVTKNRRGVVEFAVPSGRGVSIIGLRAKSNGTLTTVPVLAR